jgi:ribosomal-protein-alanine N-acetyltransferase
MTSFLFWRRKTALGALRPLRTSDGAACARLHESSFAHPWSSTEFEALLADSACVGEGLGGKAGLVGFVLSRRALDEAEMLTIVVDSGARQKGCAQRILLSHLSRLSRLGLRSLFLEVDEANAPALALYRRNGFDQVGIRKAYYARPDQMRANALIMRRSLD